MLTKGLTASLGVVASVMLIGNVRAVQNPSDSYGPGRCIFVGDMSPFMTGNATGVPPGTVVRIEYEWPSPADRSTRLVYIRNFSNRWVIAHLSVTEITNFKPRRLADQAHFMAPGERHFLGGERVARGGGTTTYSYQILSTSRKD